MDSLRDAFMTHKVAIVLAVLTALIVALPQVYFRIDHANDGIYQGIELIPDSPWSARVREVMDGHPSFGNIYQKDGKEYPYLFQPLGSIIVGYMGKILALDINNTILLSRLLFAFTVFLLFYGFVYSFSRDRLVALVSASTFLFVGSMMSPFGLSQLLQGLLPYEFLQIARPVNPLLIYFFSFGFIVSFWLYYRTKKISYGILSSILLGLNFYNYFYAWTFFYAFGGLLGLFALIRKQWRQAVEISAVFIGGILVAIPYLLNLYIASFYPTYEEVGARFGILYTHKPLFVGAVVVSALVLFLIAFPREDKERYFFGLALILAPFITMNQQIITGQVLQPNHYHWFFHKPFALILVVIIFFYLLGKTRFASYRVLLATAAICVSIAVAIFVQLTSYYTGTNDGGQIAIERQKYGSVVDWLSENVPAETQIFANNETSHMVAIYTPLNVLYHRAIPFSTLTSSKERLLDIQFIFYRLRELDGESARRSFYGSERESLSANIYGIYYRKLEGSYEEIPDEKIEEILKLYQESLNTTASIWLNDVFKKYEVEYLIWDSVKDPDWNVSNSELFKEKARFGDLIIYSIQTE